MKCVDRTVTTKNNRGLRWARHALQGAVLSLVGCSVLYELSADQCKTTEDCHALGGVFSERECHDGQCTDPEPTDTTTTGGTGGNGGSGGTENTDKTTSTTGEGGMGGEPGCSTNAECIDEKLGAPFICRDGECIQVTLPDECPVVLSGEGSKPHPRLREPEPILIGAYTVIGAGASQTITAPTLNYELALEEFMRKVSGGLSGGPNGTRRPFVAVLCNGLKSDFGPSLDHLVNTLDVPAIIAPLGSSDLVNAFEQYAGPGDTFIMSPFEADTNLTNLDDDGRMWHMLGSALDLARAYPSLVERTEAYIRGELLGGDDTTPLKVALIESDNQFLLDIGEYVATNISFNGKPALDSANADYFMRVGIDAVDIDHIAEVGDELQAFGPHIVLMTTGPEAITNDLINGIEGRLPVAWNNAHPDQPLPFYLLSPYLYNTGVTATAVEGKTSLASRMLGVNFAAAEDSSLYTAYLSRLDREYDISSLDFEIEGYENFYDATYYLMYAIAGAGNPATLRGSNIALGMERLLASGNNATQYDVGPSDVPYAVANLESNSSTKIRLNGTLGPPDFNINTGARKSSPSVYCIVPDEGTNGKYTFAPDVIRYDEENQTLEATEPPCVPGF